MLMRTDPFQELDRLTERLFEANGARALSTLMPMEAYRTGEEFVAHFDIPGVDPSSLRLDVEGNVLTIRAERTSPSGENVEHHISERPMGVFSRRFLLGDTLDTDHIQADYVNGVLTLRVPIAEQAKPRKIEISAGSGTRQLAA